MKLTSHDRPSHRGHKAAEALRTAEQPAEDFFDTRRFLMSEEMENLRRLVTVENPQEADYKLLMSAAWVGIIDSSFGEQLKRVPGFKDFLRHKFTTDYLLDPMDRAEAPADIFLYHWHKAFGTLFDPMHTFPELKQDEEIKKELDKIFPDILKAISDNSLPIERRLTLCSRFSLLLPEHKLELLTELLKPYDQDVKQLFIALETALETQDLDVDSLVPAMLLFPEQHAQVQALLQPHHNEIANEWRSICKKRMKSEAQKMDYFHVAFALAVLTAEKVSVSPEGQILLELKPAPTTPPAPLPDRPLA